MNTKYTKHNTNGMHDVFLVQTPHDLHSRIMVRIVSEQIKNAKRKLAVFISGTIASLGLFIVALRYTIEQFAQSEFPRYVSLIYTDTSLLSLYWKDLTYSFAESIPLVSIVLLLVATFILLAVFRKTIQNISLEKVLQKNLVTI